MAVFQISRIQVRRGRKGEGTGIPQLASGEMAWAIDSQELFIGNGSPAEGAPAVGNSKIITQHDNIFDLFFYTYKQNQRDELNSSIVQTGPDEYSPIIQTVNSVLDRVVWAQNFGVEPSSSVNESTSTTNYRTQAFQRAINELYLKKHFINQDTADTDYGSLQKDFRVELHFSPGLYTFNKTIYLPSYVTIVGAGVDKTVFNYIGEGQAFVFVSDEAKEYVSDVTGQFVDLNTSTFNDYLLSFVNTTSSPAKHAALNGFTLMLADNTHGFILNAVNDSAFNSIRIIGPWSSASSNETYGIKLVGSTNHSSITCKGNTFKDIAMHGVHTGVFAEYSIRYNNFNGLVIDGGRDGASNTLNVKNGVVFGVSGTLNETYGPQYNTITNGYFNSLDGYGIRVISGIGNKSQNNTFTDVGIVAGVETTSIVKFDMPGNSSLNDIFNRYDTQSTQQYNSLNASTAYKPEVEGIVYHQSIVTKQASVSQDNGMLVRLPLNTATGYKIDYLFKGSNQMRKGTLNVAVDLQDKIQFTDEYECTDESVLIGDATVPSQQQQANELLVFTAEIANDELVVSYSNQTGNYSGNITFTYNVLVQS